MRPATEAREILSVAYRATFPDRPELPWRAMRLLLAQSRGEGRWGELGGVDAAGEPYGESWGAVQAKMGPPCPPGTFEHGDSRPTAEGQKPFVWCFLGFSPSDPMAPVKGARLFLHHALELRPRAHRELMSGSARRYAKALYGDGSAPYFGGFGATVPERIQSYVDFLQSNAAEVDRALGLSSPDTAEEPAGAALGLLPVALAGAAAYFILRK